MKKPVLVSVLSILGIGICSQVWATEAQLTINLPVLEGVKVRRPYIAVWLEQVPTHVFMGNVAVWYDMHRRNNAGTKWLPDLRSWWRVSGSRATFPIDGVSGATRPAGEHIVNIGAVAAVKNLPDGEYEVLVEVVREHGGHELVRLPMQWPPRQATQKQTAGRQELGEVTLVTKP